MNYSISNTAREYVSGKRKRKKKGEVLKIFSQVNLPNRWKHKSGQKNFLK